MFVDVVTERLQALRVLAGRAHADLVSADLDWSDQLFEIVALEQTDVRALEFAAAAEPGLVIWLIDQVLAARGQAEEGNPHA